MEMNKRQFEALLRETIRETVSMGKDYVRKEAVMSSLKECLMERIASGEVSDDASLKEFFDAVDMSVKSLRMVPFDVLRRSLR